MTTLTQALRRRRRRRRLLARALFAGIVLTVVALAVAGVARIAEAVTSGTDAADGGDPPAQTVLLVNAEHPLPEDYELGELVALIGTVPVSTNEVEVAAEIVQPLRELFAGAEEAGLTGLYVTSGYRSYQRQEVLWEEAADRSYVQPAGHSEHQTGLAVDLADLDQDFDTFAESSAGRWLAENAWRYGFVLRYPEGKEHITGISYESWHFRYVGTAVAEVCHRDGLTLEEYVASR